MISVDCRTIPSSLYRTAAVLGLVALLVAPSSGAHSLPPTAPSASSASQAQAKTQALVALANRFATASSIDRPRLRDELVQAAQTRLQLLAQMLPEDAAAVVAAMLPASARARLPSFLSSSLEHDVRVSGTLEILHEDREDGSRFHYLLDSAHGRFSLHFARHAPDQLMTGAKVQVAGVQIENMLALGGSNDVQQVAPAPLPNTLGAQSTAVLLVNFADNAVQPYTVADAREAAFGTTSAFFLENSYQQAWLSGNVFGWFTIPVSSASCDYLLIASYAQSAAAAAGIDISPYSHWVFAFPKTTACTWWGLSSIGGAPSRTWINGAFEMTVLSHELGHGLGLYHSHALDCGTTTIGNTMSSTYPPAPGTCYAIEYGDLIDAMGGSYPGHFNTFQKERLGWLNAGSSPPITTVTASGTFPIEALAIQSGNPKALKILRSQDPTTGAKTWYYIESRQPLGFDSVIDSTASTVGVVSTIPDGVLLHVGTEGSGNSASLLDMSPATDTSIWDWLINAPLLVGQTFSDGDAGISVTTNSVNSTGAMVTVRLSGPGSASASMSVSTDQASYTRGQTATITAKVMSDGKPLANASVTFQIVKSTGAIVAAKATTGTKGTASYKMRLSKLDPVGSYRADASAVKGSQSASAETMFVVQ